ncbi:MAG: DUF58 domain-containing protein [Gammaproteobacteria bacterium]|nr:DUF58 domain-containing protein [Gammaproteobacteria bacterium]
MAITAITNWRDEMLAFWRHLFRRDRPESGPVTLGRRRVYIIPTRSGIIFAVILLAMLIGAINYQNSLAFALTFLLASLALVSMIHAVRNLYGLRLTRGHPQPVFAGDTARFALSLENRNGPARFALRLMLDGQQPITHDLAQNGGQWIELCRHAPRRGYLSAGRITLYSRYPLGLFHAWSNLNLAMSCLVYPRPDQKRGLPPQMLQERGSAGDQGRGSDDFASLRPYHVGDSLRHIHWKALAREQGLMTKQFGGGITEELWLHWEQLGNLGQEARLSRLTRWVLEADELGLAYGLSLPDLAIPPGRGERHRRRCLEALALFGLVDGEAPHGPQ